MDTSQIPRITDEEIDRHRRALKAAGLDPQAADRGEIRRVCGVGDRRARTIQERLKSDIRPELDGGADWEESGDKATTSRTTNRRVKTLAELAEVCEIDQSKWVIDKWRCTNWEVGMKPPATTVWVDTKDGRKVPQWVRYSDEAIIEPLYSVTAWLTRRKGVAPEDEVASLKEEAKRFAPKYPALKRVLPETGNMLEICITDHHFGCLAYAPETGYADYDLKMAEDLFGGAVDSMISRTGHARFDKVVFVVGNDLCHYDDLRITTTKGTPQDTDSRYQKVFRSMRRAVTASIDKCASLAPTDVLVVPGNHDTLTAWHLGDSLECWYRNCPDVTVNNQPTLRKYVQWGDVMLAFIHGDKGKFGDYALLMATEQPEMFGNTRWREVHTGDKHQVKLSEQFGVRVRILPTLVPPNAWASGAGYVGNQRSSEAYVWNKSEGLLATAVYSVPQEWPKAA